MAACGRCAGHGFTSWLDASNPRVSGAWLDNGAIDRAIPCSCCYTVGVCPCCGGVVYNANALDRADGAYSCWLDFCASCGWLAVRGAYRSLGVGV